MLIHTKLSHATHTEKERYKLSNKKGLKGFCNDEERIFHRATENV